MDNETKKELIKGVTFSDRKRTYKGKRYSIFVSNSKRRINYLYIIKLLAYVMAILLISFHFISMVHVCKLFVKAPSELAQTVTKEQLCVKNNYEC